MVKIDMKQVEVGAESCVIDRNRWPNSPLHAPSHGDGDTVQSAAGDGALETSYAEEQRRIEEAFSGSCRMQ